MTVEELIEALKTMPLKAEVVLPTAGSSWDFQACRYPLFSNGVLDKATGRYRVNPFEPLPPSFYKPLVILP